MKPSDRLPGADPGATTAALAVAFYALASLAEARDSDTGKHLLRIRKYVDTLAQRLRQQPRFAAILTAPYLEQLWQSLPLYDIGSIGIPDRILLKPASLDAGELALMQTHTTLARDAFAWAEQALGSPAPWLAMVKELAYCHHEKWDGSGYPQGLAGEVIPLCARLVALADVYDAQITDRVYKAGVPHEQAVKSIFQERAHHFDPDLVDAFMDVQDQFQSIAQRYADTAQDMQKKIDYLANAIAEDAGSVG